MMYGSLLTKKQLIKKLFVAYFVLFWIYNVVYLFTLAQFNTPLYMYLVGLIMVYVVIFFYMQFKQNKKRIQIDEKGIYMYSYSDMMYLQLLRNYSPKCSTLYFKALQHVTLSYTTTKKPSVQTYALLLILKDDTNEYKVELQTNAISNKDMRWLLSMLNMHCRNVEDAYQLGICLAQNVTSFDAYVHRWEEMK